MENIKHIVFDAANTIIHKPELWIKWSSVLQKNGYGVDLDEIKFKHKLMSEVIHFPDRTNAEFYKTFNAEVLLSLGIVPNPQLLEDLFLACTYLKWETFPDIDVIKKLNFDISIISNFSSKLNKLLENHFGENFFKHIIISEEFKCSKPSLEFYEKAIEKIGLQSCEIMYIGDSIKLDIAPANELGINTILIDRSNIYPMAKNRILSLHELGEKLK